MNRDRKQETSVLLSSLPTATKPRMCSVDAEPVDDLPPLSSPRHAELKVTLSNQDSKARGLVVAAAGTTQCQEQITKQTENRECRDGATATSSSPSLSPSVSMSSRNEKSRRRHRHADPIISTSLTSFPTRAASAREVNGDLNLNLGLSTVLNPDNNVVRRTIHELVKPFLLLEKLLIALWLLVPLRTRHRLSMAVWDVFHLFHSTLLGRSTGIHPDASLEYHSLTSVAYWGRFFPVTVEKMRFMLNQLQVYYPPSEGIDVKLTTVCSKNANGGKVRGAYLHYLSDKERERKRLARAMETDTDGDHAATPVPPSPPRVIYWLYGGAFLGGDVEGNLGYAETVARRCQCDVFLVEYRLIPEYGLGDAFEDARNGYEYLLKERRIPAENILLYGISSGGGLAVQLLQDLASENPASDVGSDEDSVRGTNRIPAGAALMCPFVDYTEPKGSMREYIKHDLVVNQSVFETGYPYLDIVLPSEESRIRASPVHGSFEGLPPMCVVVSEHECCYDQCITLVNRARAARVNCTLGVWKYMCHVFPLWSALVPEGRQADNFMCDWINSRFKDGNCESRLSKKEKL